MLYFLIYKLLNMFRATMCPSSGADDWLVFSPRVGIELWLQEGCQNRLVGSVSIEGLCYEPLNGHTTYQPVLTTLLQPQLNTNTWRKHFAVVSY